MQSPKSSMDDLGLFCDDREFTIPVRGIPYAVRKNDCDTIRMGNLDLVHSL